MESHFSPHKYKRSDHEIGVCLKQLDLAIKQYKKGNLFTTAFLKHILYLVQTIDNLSKEGKGYERK